MISNVRNCPVITNPEKLANTDQPAPVSQRYLSGRSSLAFVALVTIAATAHAFADPPSTDSKLSPECSATLAKLDLFSASAKSLKTLLEAMESRAADVEASEKTYFDRFDAEKTISLTGTVTEFQWSNPHAQIMLSVKNDGQADQPWTIEMNAPGGLARLGWRPQILTPGMPITVMIHPRRDGSNGGHLVTARLPNTTNGTQISGGRDRPGILQELRNSAAATDAATAELMRQMLNCGR
jgi:hypothetical protein